MASVQNCFPLVSGITLLAWWETVELCRTEAQLFDYRSK
jgi:hypothetical protein